MLAVLRYSRARSWSPVRARALVAIRGIDVFPGQVAPISAVARCFDVKARAGTGAHLERHWNSGCDRCRHARAQCRSEEHTSELQSLMRISYAVFCLKKKKKSTTKPSKTIKINTK